MARAKQSPHGRIVYSADWDGVLKTRQEMDDWDQQIQVAMGMIARTHTGAALIRAIHAAPRIMLIVPDPGTEINAETDSTNARGSVAAGLNLVDDQGRSMGRSIGGGSCTIIRITPSNYSRRDGCFSSADGGLFHEMCHGLHVMTGKSVGYISLLADFDNLDEFWAITLTNIYMSEKKYPYLRRDHHGRQQLDPALCTSESFYAFAGQQVAQVCRDSPAFTRAVARIDTPFNPIRFYYTRVAGERV